MASSKTVLITGGNRGIGAATAIEAAQAGYNVCINYNSNKNSAQSVLEQVLSFGVKGTIIQSNIGIESEVINLFDAFDDEFDSLHALINNAGIAAQQSTLENMSYERLNNIFQTNVLGSFMCAREAIKRISTKHGGQGGSIINLSSGASKAGSPFEYIDYAASKGAIDTFTIGLAKEVAQEGIRVNAVRPGYIETDFHDQIGIENRFEKMRHVIPMDRKGTATEIAKTIMWLISDDASYTSGALIDVAGGK